MPYQYNMPFNNQIPHNKIYDPSVPTREEFVNNQKPQIPKHFSTPHYEFSERPQMHLPMTQRPMQPMLSQSFHEPAAYTQFSPEGPNPDFCQMKPKASPRGGNGPVQELDTDF